VVITETNAALLDVQAVIDIALAHLARWRHLMNWNDSTWCSKIYPTPKIGLIFITTVDLCWNFTQSRS